MKTYAQLAVDTEKHRKGERVVILENPGRGMISAYLVKFENGDTEWVAPPMIESIQESK